MSPVSYYSDPPPSLEQLAAEKRGVQAQLTALTERRGMTEAIDQLLERRRRPPADDGPGSLQVDDFTAAGVRALIVRGEILVAAEPRRPDEPDGVAALAGPRADAGLAAELARRGYSAPVKVRRRLLGVSQFTSDHPASQVWSDVQDLRAEFKAEAACHYMVPLGHVIKGDDFPVLASTGRYPDPDWLQRIPSSGPDVEWRTVAIIDTGITAELRGDGRLVDVPRSRATVDPLDAFPVGGDQRLDMAAGHGTFATGAIDQLAPGCPIRMYRAADSDGLCSDQDLADALRQAVADGATIINVSMGMSTPNNVPPPDSQAAVAAIARDHPDVLIVASAGNDGGSTPMFPAALPGVIAVGALHDDLSPADWSQRGYWVTCSTVGIGVASTFVEGVEPPVRGDYDGDGVVDDDITFPTNAWGLWSGTSFAAPQICGAVARWCKATGKKPREALAQILSGQPDDPNYGSLIRLLPGTPTS